MKRVHWGWLVIGLVPLLAAVDWILDSRGESTPPPPGLTWHLVDRLEFADELRSPLIGAKPSVNPNPSKPFGFDGSHTIEGETKDGVTLARVLDGPEQNPCLEVRADPHGTGIVQVRHGWSRKGHVELCGRIRFHAYEEPKDVALLLRNVRSLPQAIVKIDAIRTAERSLTVARLRSGSFSAAEGMASLLPTRGASDILDYVAWQPFSVPFYVPEDTNYLDIELAMSLPLFAIRIDDLEIRELDPLARWDRTGRYRFANETEVTAPLKRMIRAGDDDRLSFLALPGTRFSDRVLLEPQSRLDFAVHLWRPEGLEAEATRAVELRVSSLSGADICERTVTVGPGALNRWESYSLDLSELGPGPARVEIEVPANDAQAWSEPPFLVLGDPTISAADSGGNGPKGIVLITLDALSANHVRGLGYPRATTPIIDSLMQEGVSYSHAVAPSPSTYTSLPSLMAISHRRDGWTEFAASLDPRAETLPSALTDAGFLVQGLIADYYFNPFFKGFYSRPYPYADTWSTQEEIDERLVARFDRWLDDVGDRRFFCWIHTNQPHGPNRPSPEHDLFSAEPHVEAARRRIDDYRKGPGVPGTKTLNEAAEQVSMKRHLYPKELVADAEVVLTQLYDGSIHQADALVADVIQSLKKRGLYDDTVFAVSADHGWPLAPVMNPDVMLPEGTFVVPLVLRGPGIPSGMLIDQPVSTIDIGSTFLAMVGVDTTSFEGRDLRQTMTKSKVSSRVLVPCQTEDYLIGYWGRWKFAVSRESFQSDSLSSGGAHLFDLEEDPDGLHDVLGNHPEVAASLLEALKAWQERDGAFQQLELSGLVKGHLRRAGYLPDSK